MFLTVPTWKPKLQWHLYDPTVLTQVPLPHRLGLDEHSSMSVQESRDVVRVKPAIVFLDTFQINET